MKNYLALILIFAMSPAFALTKICNSSDFNPSTSTGMSLRLVFDQSNRVIEAQALKGSWNCAGDDKAPVKVAHNSSLAIYKADFGCSDIQFHPRILVPLDPSIQEAAFQFTFPTDDVNGSLVYKLSCRVVQ